MVLKYHTANENICLLKSYKITINKRNKTSFCDCITVMYSMHHRNWLRCADMIIYEAVDENIYFCRPATPTIVLMNSFLIFVRKPWVFVEYSQRLVSICHHQFDKHRYWIQESDTLIGLGLVLALSWVLRHCSKYDAKFLVNSPISLEVHCNW